MGEAPTACNVARDELLAPLLVPAAPGSDASFARPSRGTAAPAFAVFQAVRQRRSGARLVLDVTLGKRFESSPVLANLAANQSHPSRCALRRPRRTMATSTSRGRHAAVYREPRPGHARAGAPDVGLAVRVTRAVARPYGNRAEGPRRLKTPGASAPAASTRIWGGVVGPLAPRTLIEAHADRSLPALT
jgi:hypothetical protein